MMKKALEKFKMLKKPQKACFILEVVLGILTITVGILFIIRVQWLYNTYKDIYAHPYSTATIWEAFYPIMAVVIVWGIVLIAAGVMSIIFPQEKRFRYKGALADNIRELEAKLPKEPVEGAEVEYAIIKEKKRNRLIGFIVSLVITLICCVFAYCYLLNPKNFVGTTTAELMSEMAKCMEHIAPFIVISFATAVLVFTLNEIWAKQEYESLKYVLKSAKMDLRPLPRRKISNKGLWIIRGVVLVAAVTFIVAGIFNGGAAEALKKAVAICKECIGIG